MHNGEQPSCYLTLSPLINSRASLIAVIGCWLRGFAIMMSLFESYRGVPFSYFAMLLLNMLWVLLSPKEGQDIGQLLTSAYSLFPVAPVAAIVPSEHSHYFLWLGLAWWYLLPFAFLSTKIITCGDRVYGVFYILSYVIVDVMLLMLTVLITTAHKRLGTLLFHFGFTFWISLWVGKLHSDQFFPFPDGGAIVIWPHFEWPMVFAALATILYFMALLRGDDIVFSRTLGGPGIQPISLNLHSSEPEYNAITDEGRIRLTWRKDSVGE